MLDQKIRVYWDRDYDPLNCTEAPASVSDRHERRSKRGTVHDARTRTFLLERGGLTTQSAKVTPCHETRVIPSAPVSPDVMRALLRR